MDDGQAQALSPGPSGFQPDLDHQPRDRQVFKLRESLPNSKKRRQSHALKVGSCPASHRVRLSDPTVRGRHCSSRLLSWEQEILLLTQGTY